MTQDTNRRWLSRRTLVPCLAVGLAIAAVCTLWVRSVRRQADTVQSASELLAARLAELDDALVRIEGARTVKDYDTALGHADCSLQAIGDLGRDAAPAVSRCVDILTGPERRSSDGDSDLQGTARIALFAIGEPAFEPTVKLLGHHEARVQKSAGATLTHWLGRVYRSDAPVSLVKLLDTIPAVEAALAKEEDGSVRSTLSNTLHWLKWWKAKLARDAANEAELARYRPQ